MQHHHFHAATEQVHSATGQARSLLTGVRADWARTAAVATVVLLLGCAEQVDSFPRNEIFATRMALESGLEVERAATDVQTQIESWFGTPNEPQWPSDLAEDGTRLVDPERLRQAAGPVSSDEQDVHFGLYRKHCILCHGTSGDGLGPTAKLLNPYPRNFRLGKFKYKRTPTGVKPTRDDIANLLRCGVPGTSMAAFNLLKPEEIEALVDYVIYLSVRGEVERNLLRLAAMDLDYEDGESLADVSGETQDILDGVVESWLGSEEKVPVVVPPESQPVWGASSGPELEESIARGRELFQGDLANCSKCHGLTAMGDGQQNDYDDWIKDYTSLAGLNPADREQLRPMFDAGALKPRNIYPRNLRSGVFRGGARPEDVYLRIVHGIEGTPMPAVPFNPDNEPSKSGLTESQVWDLVNYVLSLPGESLSRGSVAAKGDNG